MRGLGIRRASDVALPAFIASSYATAELVQQLLPTFPFPDDSNIKAAVAEWCGVSGEPVPEDSLQHIQRAWDEPLARKAYNSLLNNAPDNETRARLLAVATKESGAWLSAIPSAPLGNLLNDDALRIAVALRVGTRIVIPHTCRCGTWVDESGRHGLRCRQNAGRLPRHHAINDIIKRALVSAEIPAVLEPSGICRDDGKRPDGMTIIPWETGRSLVWDATCVDSFAASNLPHSSERAGAAAESAEVRKREKYGGLDGRFHFVPVGVETLGSWGPAATALIHSIGRRVVEATGERRSVAFLRERISIAIQRGNAASIMATVPPARSLDDFLF